MIKDFGVPYHFIDGDIFNHMFVSVLSGFSASSSPIVTCHCSVASACLGSGGVHSPRKSQQVCWAPGRSWGHYLWGWNSLSWWSPAVTNMWRQGFGRTTLAGMTCPVKWGHPQTSVYTTPSQFQLQDLQSLWLDCMVGQLASAASQGAAPKIKLISLVPGSVSCGIQVSLSPWQHLDQISCVKSPSLVSSHLSWREIASDFSVSIRHCVFFVCFCINIESSLQMYKK